MRLRGVAHLFREAAQPRRCALLRSPTGGFVASAELDLARVTFFLEVCVCVCVCVGRVFVCVRACACVRVRACVCERRACLTCAGGVCVCACVCV